MAERGFLVQSALVEWLDRMFPHDPRVEWFETKLKDTAATYSMQYPDANPALEAERHFTQAILWMALGKLTGDERIEFKLDDFMTLVEFTHDLAQEEHFRGGWIKRQRPHPLHQQVAHASLPPP